MKDSYAFSEALGRINIREIPRYRKKQGMFRVIGNMEQKFWDYVGDNSVITPEEEGTNPHMNAPRCTLKKMIEDAFGCAKGDIERGYYHFAILDVEAIEKSWNLLRRYPCKPSDQKTG